MALVGQRLIMIGSRFRRPRRCGRIVGCRASQPTPGHWCPAIRSGGAAYFPGRRRRSIQPALVAQPHHLVDEGLLLLVVEAREQRVGGVSHVALVEGAVVEELRLVAHLLDDVVGRIALGAGNAQVQPLSAVVAEIVHRAVEGAPVLLLIGREVQLLLDPLDIGVAGGDDLVGGELRCAGLGQHLRLLGALAGLGRLRFRRVGLAIGLGAIRLGGVRLGGVRLGGVGLGRIGLGSIGFGTIGFGGVGLGVLAGILLCRRALLIVVAAAS